MLEDTSNFLPTENEANGKSAAISESIANKKEEEAEDKDLMVIGAGLPRTGTVSLSQALEDLLGSPCHHFKAFFEEDANSMQVWRKALAGEKVTREEWKGSGANPTKWPQRKDTPSSRSSWVSGKSP